MKRLMIAIVLLAFALSGCGSSAGNAAQTAGREILAIYSCPNTQIITNEDGSKETADTVIYLFKDLSYTQYVNHENRYEIYSEGTFEVNFDWNEKGWQYATPHILTVHADRLHQAGHKLKKADLTYDVDLDKVSDHCLYPDNVRTDLTLVAAFMQVDKQKLVKRDGSEEYLPTMWFYYDDGTFQQYALYDEKEDVLFSTGEYSLSGGGFADPEAVLTIHRNQKYQDGTGLSAYDSTHDYVIGGLDFIRIYPEMSD